MHLGYQEDVIYRIDNYIHHELSGHNFKNICDAYGNNKFYRFLNDDLVHNNFEYIIGLNVDTNPFNPSGDYLEGGLSFCDKPTAYLYWKNYGKKLAIVEIPNNARVWIEKESFKADKLFITKIIDFENVTDNFWLSILKNDYHVLACIKNQTKSICKAAIKKNGLALEFIRDQTAKHCLSAVKRNGLALEHVNETNHSYLNHIIDRLAVKQNGLAIEFVHNQNDDICILAVKNDPLSIQFIKSPPYKICELAVSLNGYALCYIDNQTRELCILAVEKNGLALEYVKEQTYDICALAVNQNKDALQYVRDLSMAVQLFDITREHNIERSNSGKIAFIKGIKNQTKSVREIIKYRSTDHSYEP